MTFPPQHWSDIDGYDPDEMVDGYLECSADEPAPGPNRSDGYRWGWMNRLKDRAGEDDGFDHIRFAYLHAMREMR